MQVSGLEEEPRCCHRAKSPLVMAQLAEPIGGGYLAWSEGQRTVQHRQYGYCWHTAQRHSASHYSAAQRHAQRLDSATAAPADSATITDPRLRTAPGQRLASATVRLLLHGTRPQRRLAAPLSWPAAASAAASATGQRLLAACRARMQRHTGTAPRTAATDSATASAW